WPSSAAKSRKPSRYPDRTTDSLSGQKAWRTFQNGFHPCIPTTPVAQKQQPELVDFSLLSHQFLGNSSHFARLVGSCRLCHSLPRVSPHRGRPANRCHRGVP